MALSANSLPSISSDEKLSPAVVKMKWREEQIAKQMPILAEISCILRYSRTPEENGKNPRNQTSFSDLDIAFRRNQQALVNQTEDIQCFEFSQPIAATFPVRSLDALADSNIATCRTAESVPCLQGWIAKQCAAKTLGLRILKHWKVSWFVASIELGSLTLSRYRDEECTLPKKSMRLCSMPCAAREAAWDGSGRFCFSVSVIGSQQRTLLGAGSQQEASRWTHALNSMAAELLCCKSHGGAHRRSI